MAGSRAAIQSLEQGKVIVLFMYLSCKLKVEINFMVYLNPETSSLVWTFWTGPKIKDLLSWTPCLQEGRVGHVLQRTLLCVTHQDIFTILGQKVNKMFNELVEAKTISLCNAKNSVSLPLPSLFSL